MGLELQRKIRIRAGNKGHQPIGTCSVGDLGLPSVSGIHKSEGR